MRARMRAGVRVSVRARGPHLRGAQRHDPQPSGDLADDGAEENERLVRVWVGSNAGRAPGEGVGGLECWACALRAARWLRVRAAAWVRTFETTADEANERTGISKPIVAAKKIRSSHCSNRLTCG